MSFIRFENLSRSFADQEVLNGVNLEINKGESIVVIGQSGCGKSVLLKHLIRLLEPDSGRVMVDGEDLSTLSQPELVAWRRRVSLLFQGAALFDSMSVSENVGLGLRESRRYSNKEIDEIVISKLELVGLAASAEKFPSELSGGMRKRVGLARAIATDPEILLCDEPTTGLDPIMADMINNLIVELNEKLHVTSIAVTHDMTSAYKIASRIVMLHEGRVEFNGTPEQTRTSDNPVVQQFINGQAEGPIST